VLLATEMIEEDSVESDDWSEDSEEETADVEED
jgi:hypothetical protein